MATYNARGQVPAQENSGRAAVPPGGQPRPPGPPRPSGPPPGSPRPPGPPGGSGHPPALVGRPRRRWRKVFLTVALSLLLVLGLATGGGWLYARGLEDNMSRVDAFSPIAESDRPTKAHAGTRNILLLGSDSRDPDGDSGDAYRADTIMLMHIPASEDNAYLISIPRDLWVYVPPTADGSAGDREAKVNAATAFGGVPLAVQTIELYTGVRIDHVMMVDFGGFVEVTDALGGVEMEIEQTIQSIHGERRVFEEGRQELSGEEALDYIRQRYQFADGDFTRMRNQQQFLRALMDKAASTGTLTNPSKLNAFLQTATSTLTVDEEFSLIDTGWNFRHLRSDRLTFLTSPHAGTGFVGDESVVLSDDGPAAELYEAVRADRMAQWAADNPDRVGDD
ncbi:LCP family protein [Natronosporangium hydrolyticum]|uniref:LCP family protein n=1 Tax=Natronosporangium hydrolyticum TaxID=2811111 RepID=A0A895YFU8_9ACTN|nr:LCP family protein [Natronosporangium hydrolyticum]QSB14965.1 LCP family protein [Natronosporangium hydrolyticum]